MKPSRITTQLPTLGIFAFALASVWSLYQLFNNSALHPTPLYWIPAALVELVTAWLAFQAVESLRIVTDTKALKRDKAFHKFVVIGCVVLSSPTLGVSFVANRYEFRGHIGLALLFPVSCIACAVASAIPHIKSAAVDVKVERVREDVQKWRDRAQELEQRCAMIEQRCAELEQELTAAKQPRAMTVPDSTDYERICAGMNGNTPSNAREVNMVLNDAGYYAVADSTARSWV